eukprot:jgi/Tetstr1/440881/TSEL_029153.t1
MILQCLAMRVAAQAPPAGESGNSTGSPSDSDWPQPSTPSNSSSEATPVAGSTESLDDFAEGGPSCLKVTQALAELSGLNFASVYGVALAEQGFLRFIDRMAPVTVLIPTDELASRKDLLELGKRFQTLDGGNVVSVVSSADDTSNNSTRGSRTRLQGAIGSYATVLGDIQLGDLCPVGEPGDLAAADLEDSVVDLEDLVEPEDLVVVVDLEDLVVVEPEDLVVALEGLVVALEGLVVAELEGLVEPVPEDLAAADLGDSVVVEPEEVAVVDSEYLLALARSRAGPVGSPS